MPSNASNCRDRSELMDDVAWKEINVVVVERNSRIFDSFALQLVKLCIFDPLNALRDRRFVEVKLKLSCEKREGLC